jgi:hypothetical protein
MLTRIAQQNIEKEQDENGYCNFYELNDLKESLCIGEDYAEYNLDEFLVDVKYNVTMIIQKVWRLDGSRIIINDKLVYDVSKPVNAYVEPVYHAGYE